MSLRLRLSLVYLIIASLFLGATYLAIRVFTLVAAEADAVIARDTAMIRDLERLRGEIDRAVKASRLAATGQETLSSARLKRKAAGESLADLRNNILPEEAAPFARIEGDWTRIQETMERMETNTKRAASLFRREILPVLTGLGQAIQEMEAERRAVSFGRVQKIQEAIRKARANLTLLAVLLALAAVGLVLILKRYILRPLELLSRATDHVAQGDFEYRIAPPARRDEISAVIEHFNDMNRRLAEAEEMKKEFVSIVTHEMKTPLTLLQGYAEVLALPVDKATEEERREALEIVGRETATLTELTNDFFDVARARARMFRVDAAPVDLSRELGTLLRPFKKLAEKNKIVFKWNVSDLPEMVVDVKRIGQAVRNLVMNAFKFTPAGGHIEVRGSSAGDNIVLEIADDGPGIPAEDLPHLFTRFYQRKQKPGQSRGGAGLGLAVVREIALAHGGNVEVESEEGKGTRFRIVLPGGANA